MSVSDDHATRAERLIRQKLECLQRCGVAQIAKPAGRNMPDTQQNRDISEQRPACERPVDTLDQLGEKIAACTQCTQLAATRTQTVPGAGNPKTRLCFMGEAPGADEDRQGEPFVGAAGQLLNKIIAACTLRREEVYILNVLKCRPPGNRTPAPEEIANCRGYFERQLEIIQPEFICCLGLVAAQTLLSTSQSLGKLRGRFHDYRGIRVMATYHPAYLLRYPNMKRAAWEDMKMLMREMGLAIPGE